jgi:hypothetical protein
MQFAMSCRNLVSFGFPFSDVMLSFEKPNSEKGFATFLWSWQ